MNMKLYLGIVLVLILIIVATVVIESEETEIFGGGRNGGGGFGGDWGVVNSSPSLYIETAENKEGYINS